jgi:hypothetical protein
MVLVMGNETPQLRTLRCKDNRRYYSTLRIVVDPIFLTALLTEGAMKEYGRKRMIQ